MRTPALIARMGLGLALATVVAVAGCGGDEAAAGATLADRWLRVGEDLGTGVQVYDGTLPPDLSQLLNDGVTPSGGDEAIALPVHPDAKLLGSFHLRRPDATNLLWLIFDVPGNDADVYGVVNEQLDQSPWQIVGGQSSAAISVVRFLSTLNGNIDGTAVIQPLPSTAEFALEIERSGETMTLDVTRSAPAPLLAADFVDGDGAVVVRRVGGGGAVAGLAVDDRITSVAGEPVQTIADVDRVLRGLVNAGEPAVALVYIIELGAAQAPREPTFVLPSSRDLPADFPAAFLIDDAMTVIDVSWANQGGQGAAYQATLLTATDTAALSRTFREAIEQQGWQITDDQAVGFATQLDFASPDGAITGRASIDAFTADPTLTAVGLQLQASGASGG
jgi:hypothetical protein